VDERVQLFDVLRLCGFGGLGLGSVGGSVEGWRVWRVDERVEIFDVLGVESEVCTGVDQSVGRGAKEPPTHSVGAPSPHGVCVFGGATSTPPHSRPSTLHPPACTPLPHAP
jgi:hypothetical protein